MENDQLMGTRWKDLLMKKQVPQLLIETETSKVLLMETRIPKICCWK